MSCRISGGGRWRNTEEGRAVTPLVDTSQSTAVVSVRRMAPGKVEVLAAGRIRAPRCAVGCGADGAGPLSREVAGAWVGR